MNMTPLTDDGVEVKVGLRVFTNDWVWGTVIQVCGDKSPISHSYHTDMRRDCWHDVKMDANEYSASGLYNCERMTTRPPAGAPRDPQA